MTENATMNPGVILEFLKEAIPFVKEVSKMHGFVHKRTTAEINGVKGFLYGIILFGMKLHLTT